MSSQPILVLDLGASKATCVSAKLDDKAGFVVQAIATEPCDVMKKGVVIDPEAASEAIRAVIAKIGAKVDLETEELIVSVGGPHIEGMNVQGFKPVVPRGRQITYQDVLEVINHSRAVVLPSDREQIQALPRAFKVDQQRDVQKPIGMPAGKLEVTTYLVSGTIDAMQALNAAVKGAGYNIEQMIFAPLAAGVGVLTQDEMELGAAAGDIGKDTTNVGVFANGSIAHGATLPLGSNSITKDIATLLKTTLEEAEHLKVTAANANSATLVKGETVDVLQLGQTLSRPLQKSVLSEIVEARVKEIALMVKSQIEKSGLYALLPGGVILTGGGAQLMGIERVFDDQLKHFRIRVAEPKLPARLPDIAGSAVAVGLASFALQCYDELAPASGSSIWKDRVKSLFSMINGR